MKVNKENEEFFLELVSSGTLIVDKNGTVTNSKTGNQLARKPNKKSGYHGIAFRDGNKIRHQLVHRLVQIIYNDGFTEEQPLCNHKDGNKSNNHYNNLEKCSYLENFIHSIDLELRSLSFFEGRVDNPKGEKASSAKLKDEEALDIIEKYKTGNYTHRSLAKEYDMDHTTIGDIIRRQTFKNLKGV